MPRCKVLEKFNTSIPVNNSPEQEPAIVESLAPAIVTPILPVNHTPQTLKRLAGTSFLVDVDTGLVYLEPSILRAMKNS